MRYTHIKLFSSFVFICLLLTACLKDEEFDNGERGTNIDNNKRIVELPGPTTGFVNVDLVGSPNDTAVNVVRVRLASSAPAENDIQVTLVMDQALVSEYNSEHGTSYVIPDPSLYSLSSLTVTIPQGSREGYVTLTTIPDALIGEEYALGFRITSVSDPSVIISNNFKEQVAGLTIRNIYDGTYNLDFGFYHPTASPDYATASTIVELHTTGPNSLKLFWPLLGGYGHPILAGGAFSYFASQEPEFTINPLTNKVTVQNDYPGAVTFYTMAPGYDSRYDPATKTIYAKFGYNYAPGPVFNPAANREWTDTLSFIGPR